MRQRNKKKKIVWQQAIGFLFMVLLGVICGIVIVSYIDRSVTASSPFLELLILFIGMYAALFFHLILHEGGHLIFGLLTGYQFGSFRVASFLWLKEDGKLRIKRLSIAGTGGQCLMIPPNIQDGKLPLVLYNLGGSLLNLLIGALFLLVYLLCPSGSVLSPLFLIFAVVGFTIAMMNGIPMRMGTVDNDGYNAFALSKNKEAVEAFWVQLKTVEQTAKGVRIKDMPAEWFAMPSDDAMKNSMVAVRGVLACNRLMDEGNFEEADSCMKHLLEIESGMVGLHHDLLLCDRLFVELIGENRTEAIEAILTKEQKKFMKAMKRNPSVLRTQYALALLFEQDIEKAGKLRREFEKTAKTYPYSHEIEAERALMEIAEKKQKTNGSEMVY